MQTDALKLDPIIRPIVTAMGYELWGYDFSSSKKQAFLRVYIDSPDGISVDDCARVSHQLSGVLDVEDPIRVPYNLEISSPGLDRPLFRANDFAAHHGRQVKIRLLHLVDGRRNVKGELLPSDDDVVRVAEQDKTWEFALVDIDEARLIPELP